MLFRVLKENIGYSDIPDLQARVETATKDLTSEQDQYQAIKDLLDKDTSLIPANITGSQRDTLTTIWANTLLYDGFDGEFTNLLLSMVGQDYVLAYSGDKILQLWLLYDEGRLNLSDGIIPPKDFYGNPALYKDISNDDFEYLVNAEMIVNHNEKVRQYIKATPSQDDVREVFFKGFRGSQGLNTAEEVYQNIEALSAKYGESESIMSISDAIEKDSGEKIASKNGDTIANVLAKYVSDYLMKTSPTQTSDSGFSEGAYHRALIDVVKVGDKLKDLIDTESCKDFKKSTIALAIIGWLDKNVDMEDYQI